MVLTFNDNSYIKKAFELALEYMIQYTEIQIKLYCTDNYTKKIEYFK